VGVSDREHRRRGDGADGDRDHEDRAIEDRAVARCEAGEDWLTALLGATREVGAGPRRLAAGRVTPTARLPVQRRAEGTPTAPADAAAKASSLTGGSPLPEALRRDLERALGVALDEVRVHTGGDADEAARALGARAFAVDQDIGFRAGAYQPDQPDGVHLIAHEVAHTVQAVQARGAGATGGISEPGDRSEREADAFADGFVAGASATVAPLGADTAAVPAIIPPGWAAGDPAQSLWSLAHGAPAPAGPRVQLARLLDYADASHPEYDPSRISDAQIEATNEYRSLMDPALVWQTRDHVTAEEARLACRLILRVLRTGGHVNWDSQARTYVMQAREQAGSMHGAEGLSGNQHWTGQSPDLTATEFGRWLLSGGPEPSATAGDMNCWELVMFSAYRAGFTTKPRMEALYRRFAADMAASGIAAGVAVFEAAVRRGPEQVYDPANPDSPRPVAGDLVIFGTVANHAAVATGNYPGGKVEVMSLWTQNARHVFRTTVEDLGTSGPFRFFSPHW
jgi:Domain of unknown function (DUF4157)